MNPTKKPLSSVSSDNFPFSTSIKLSKPSYTTEDDCTGSYCEYTYSLDVSFPTVTFTV